MTEALNESDKVEFPFVYQLNSMGWDLLEADKNVPSFQTIQLVGSTILFGITLFLLLQ